MASNNNQSLSILQGDLVNRIVDDIVRENYADGHHLTEVEISKKFEVSRTPVRSALRYLENQGVLRFEENKGFFLAISAKDIQEQSLNLPTSAEEELYLNITRDRTAKTLPGGFSEPDLTRRYHCSSALLSRVLTRMSEEGLIKRSKGHGWSFVQLLDTKEAVFESYRFRILIEPAAFLEPTFKVNTDALKRLWEAHSAFIEDHTQITSGMSMFNLNAEFHELLASFSGNRFFLQSVVHQNRLRRLNEYSAFKDKRRMIQSCREHLLVIDALLEKDQFWAVMMLRKHLNEAFNYVRKGKTASLENQINLVE